MRERLIDMLVDFFGENDDFNADMLADYLIDNGVVVLMRDGNDFNPDVYCPYRGNNLTSAWEEEQ